MTADTSRKNPTLLDCESIYRCARSAIVQKVDYWKMTDDSPWMPIFKDCRKLAEIGYGKSYYLLHLLYGSQLYRIESSALSRHFENLSFEWCMANKDIQDAEVWNDLGEIYQGLEVEDNFYHAAYWFAKAAEHGDPVAQYNMAECYRFGLGTQVDIQKAFYWCTKSADQGNGLALSNMGYLIKENGVVGH